MLSLIHDAHESDTVPLIAVRDLREDIVAGLGGATLEVRTLDGVSLDVHAGDLVLVTGRVASGATSLLTALAGVRQSVQGERWLAWGVRTRRASIGADARDVIIRAWRERAVEPEARFTSSAARVVYLLRVRTLPDSALSMHARRSWRAWALEVRAGRGAVVLADVAGSCSGSVSPPVRRAVHEYPVASEHRAPSEHESARVRNIALASGRIVRDELSGARAFYATASPAPACRDDITFNAASRIAVPQGSAG